MEVRRVRNRVRKTSAGGILGVQKQIGGKQIDVLKQQICFPRPQMCFKKNKFVFIFTNRHKTNQCVKTANT